MHTKFGKDRACGSGDILAGTDRQTNSSQYFATAPVGKVTRTQINKKLKPGFVTWHYVQLGNGVGLFL